MIKIFNLKLKSVFLFLFITFTSNIIAQNKISIKIIKGDLKELIKEIENKTDFKFIYSDKLSLSAPISIYAKSITIEDILKKSLDSNKIKFNINGRNIVLAAAKEKSGIKRKISR